MGNSSPAPNWTVVLASGNKAVSRAIRSSKKTFAHVRLKVQKNPLPAFSQSQQDEVFLVLLDITQATDRDEFQSWLMQYKTGDQRVATVSWGAIEQNVVSAFVD